MVPRGENRVVFHADGHPRNHIPLHPKEEDLYPYVDRLAEGGVDVFSLACFHSGQALWQSAHADATGGKAFHADDRESLEAIYREIDELTPEELKTTSYRPTRPLFHWPLGAALLLTLTYHLARGSAELLRSRRTRGEHA